MGKVVAHQISQKFVPYKFSEKRRFLIINHSDPKPAIIGTLFTYLNQSINTQNSPTQPNQKK
jgi:hypothetical protein